MGISDAVAGVDRAVGERLERAVKRHHVRRLRRSGWERILQPDLRGFAVNADPGIRDGNSVDVLIDGAEALPAIQSAMLQARSHVYLTNWFVSPDFRLESGAAGDSRHGGPTIQELLAELSTRVDVRVLLWSGPPVPWSSYSRGDVRKTRDAPTQGTRVRCLLDAHERPLHTHHEKIVIIDDEVAFVGGLDYTARDGDRFDSNDHPYREGIGWHDMTARVRGPAAADVAAHFRLRWQAVSGERMPPVRPSETAGGHRVQVLATIPQIAYPAIPRGAFGILEAYRRALSSAEHLIYIENQFLWSPEIVDVLRSKLISPPTDDFRMLLLLPAKAMNGADDTRGQLGTLVEADNEHRLVASTIYSRAGSASHPVYVHAKLAIVDDRWLTVGSANLNDHSLFNDTELNVAVYDTDVARTTRQRLWAEHLELPAAAVSADPASVIDHLWRPIAEEQYRRRGAGEPMTHRLAMLPHMSRRAERLLGPLDGLILDG